MIILKILLILVLLQLGKPVYANEVVFLVDTSSSMKQSVNGSNGIAPVGQRRIDQVLRALTTLPVFWPEEAPYVRVMLWNSSPTELDVYTIEDVGQYFKDTQLKFAGGTALGKTLFTKARFVCTHYIVLTDQFPHDGSLFMSELRRVLDTDPVTVFVAKWANQVAAIDDFQMYNHDSYNVIGFEAANPAAQIAEQVKKYSGESCNIGM